MFTFAHVIVFLLGALVVITLALEDDGNPPML